LGANMKRRPGLGVGSQGLHIEPQLTRGRCFRPSNGESAWGEVAMFAGSGLMLATT